jgi:acyl-CoA synthetase (AMP-forming)/AMP-acid ligase II
MTAIERTFTKFNNKIFFGYMAQTSSVISNLYIRDYTISTTNFIKILKFKKTFRQSAFRSLLLCSNGEIKIKYIHLYIFVSRFFKGIYGVQCLMNCSTNDVIYCVLPLYHSSAGIMGVGSVFTSASTLVVRRKFSASRFWEECIQYKATVSKIH